MLKKLYILSGAFAALALAIAAYIFSAPVVVLHYSSAATKPASYFYNEDDFIIKEYIRPGDTVKFRTSHHPDVDYFVDVSLPVDSHDHVEIRPPFSRVDVYIGADTKITRTVIKEDFIARFVAE